jgi:hypothetical protein
MGAREMYMSLLEPVRHTVYEAAEYCEAYMRAKEVYMRPVELVGLI